MTKYLSVLCLIVVPAALAGITVTAMDKTFEVGVQGQEPLKITLDEPIEIWGGQFPFRVDGPAEPVDAVNVVGGDAFIQGPYEDAEGEYYIAMLTSEMGVPIELPAGTTTLLKIVWECDESGQTTIDLEAQVDDYPYIKGKMSGVTPENPFVIYPDTWDDGVVSFVYGE